MNPDIFEPRPVKPHIGFSKSRLLDHACVAIEYLNHSVIELLCAGRFPAQIPPITPIAPQGYCIFSVSAEKTPNSITPIAP